MGIKRSVRVYDLSFFGNHQSANAGHSRNLLHRFDTVNWGPSAGVRSSQGVSDCAIRDFLGGSIWESVDDASLQGPL